MNAKLLIFVSLGWAVGLAVAKPVHEDLRPNARPVAISHIPHHPIGSTAIASIGYSKRRHILEIEFVNGAVYRYLDITPDVYRELMIADSKTRYYDFNIRGNYASIRIRPPPAMPP